MDDVREAERPDGRNRPATAGEGLRFAFGTLSVLPVRVGRWDRAAASAGMRRAPLVGVVIGGCAGAVGGLLLTLGGGPLLAAVGAAAVPAVLTRGLHLDGLADTADGLGSGRPADEALRIMKRSDIGPFGVLTLVLTLLAQVSAVAGRFALGWAEGAAAVLVAAATARAAMTLASRGGIPPARADGLGAVVAGSVRPRAAWGLAALTVLGAALLGGALGGPGAASHHGLAALAGLGAAELLLRRCHARFGGVTGDVFGALAETAATATLLVLALG